MNCRHCGAELTLPLVDLGSAPPSNAYLTKESLHAPEKWFPLRVLVCKHCWLVQTEDFSKADELFDAKYAYFSGFSDSWLQHCERHVTDTVIRFQLNDQSHVVEVAANDGYLLQYVQRLGIPCTGIEPTASTATVARSKGIPIIEKFFNTSLAKEMALHDKRADLAIANNVLAHVPDINDFVAGFTILLKPQGVVTFEFPHVLNLITGNQFDTIYHEHFSYLSLNVVDRIFTAHGLHVFDVAQIPTHGGSLRVFAQRRDSGQHPRESRVDDLIRQEIQIGMHSVNFYNSFQVITEKIKYDFLSFLLKAKRRNKIVAAYGAAAKGNTLLNYAGVRSDLIPFVVDRNPAKQGNFLPGSRIPIVEEALLKRTKPDYILIFPWNIKTEIIEQLQYIKSWQGTFVSFIPHMEVF
jgi:SAM-dependent methyltransferase